MQKKSVKNRHKSGILQQVSSLSIYNDYSTTFNNVKSIHMDIKPGDSHQEYPYAGKNTNYLAWRMFEV